MAVVFPHLYMFQCQIFMPACPSKDAVVAAVLTRIFHAAAPNLMKDGDPIRERPLMTSDFRVGGGVQNDPKIGRFRVEKGS